MFAQKRRRTATSVLGGDYDPRPPRDVLTSLLNGVPSNKLVEKDEDVRHHKKQKHDKVKHRERSRELDKDFARARSSSRAREKLPTASSFHPIASSSISAPVKRPIAAPHPHSPQAPFWQTRPTITIPHMSRSVSISPPPMVSSPPTTPGPSISSATSATSSKRPHTPYDDEEIGQEHTDRSYSPQPQQPKQRKKRPAARKGWKGWVEGSPPPSQKLINLDTAVVLGERKTRSGKSFDAIGVGKDSWV
ncbi:hypothetical protein QCA50_015477 [Cerrena zonata]|uniref:Uncharacterized protein n=1 Tax=Cerrena zonata TaxID=2478898 RepID=A0AAW0FXE4_9APHY